MATSYTNKIKLNTVDVDDTGWGGAISHNFIALDAILKNHIYSNYVISGLTITQGLNREFSYSTGSVNINGIVYSLPGAAGEFYNNNYNWVYISNGALTLSTSPLSGTNLILLYIVLVSDNTVSCVADCRPYPPRVDGVAIAPESVSPTGNINLAAGKRIISSDFSVGNNTVILPDSLEVLVWANQTTAKTEVTVDCSALVPSGVKFGIFNAYMATYGMTYNEWAVLTVRRDVGVYQFQNSALDYGHGSTEAIDGYYIGQSHQFIVRFDAGGVLAKTTIPSGGITVGSYTCYLDLVGYIM